MDSGLAGALPSPVSLSRFLTGPMTEFLVGPPSLAMPGIVVWAPGPIRPRPGSWPAQPLRDTFAGIRPGQQEENVNSHINIVSP